MFAFLVSVGARAMLKGYNVTDADLEAIGLQLATLIGRDTLGVANNARNAAIRAKDHYVMARAEKFVKLNPRQAYLDKWCKR